MARTALLCYHATVPRRLPGGIFLQKEELPMDVLHAVRVALYLLSRISVCGANNVKYLSACFEELGRLMDSLQQEQHTQEGA